ncbi:hypothetical protein E3P99_00070 [Wallemia hederae]|uniref:Selenoprotein O n=1 Tax=Wallemia hederae TaxID=1540922 RepID=A0A4T0FXH5_9BASI|nr:hypothetical protein E3P99_00070 [Wallemia hederae]
MAITAREALPYNTFKGFKRLVAPFGYNFKEGNGVQESATKHPYKVVKTSSLAHHHLLPSFELDYDILSGNKIIRNDNFTAYCLAYAGHQFGFFAGQLGDGRAITVLDTVDKNGPVQLQLKGAGLTPFSRFGDGYAVLRSSVREFLASEYMAVLGIPTTRALSLISLPELEVQRETVETGAIVSRLAPSWLRIGSFQLLNPPQSSYFGLERDWKMMSHLVHHVENELFETKMDFKSVILEVAMRNAVTVAKWQAVGFCHGVLNSDNISLLGLTLDYGPYAFMDIYNSGHICNHTDQTGFYAFKLQPSRVLWDMQQLLNSTAEVVGAEEEGVEITPTFAFDSEGKECFDNLFKWRKRGLELNDEIEDVFKETFQKQYLHEMGLKLGVKDLTHAEHLDLVNVLLTIMQDQELDYSSTFRALSSSADAETVADRILSVKPVTSFLQDGAKDAWLGWLSKYFERVNKDIEAGVWGDKEQAQESRLRSMQSHNPRFVLRQWVLEECIAKLQAGDQSTFDRVFDMALKPFEPYHEDTSGNDLTAEQDEEKRLCGLGDESLLGYQCSCSS